MTHLELCSRWARASDFFKIEAYPETKILKGGIEFMAPLAVGLSLVPSLRSCTRVLLRESTFDASTERNFLDGLSKIHWEDYFKKNSTYNFKFTSKSSKLSMQKQIRLCLDKILKPIGAKHAEGGATIYVRIFRDQCNISLDCSGEASFKRGDKGSIASLRASTASGLLQSLFRGLNEPFVLIDPMCGAGTFMIEALNINKPLKRSFAYENFPSHTTLTDFTAEALAKEPESFVVAEKLYAFDNSKKALGVATSNLKGFDNVVIQPADLFSPKDGLVETDLKKVVVLNPPWGKRLPGASADILETVYEKYKPDRIGYLMPAQWKFSQIPLQKVRDLAILNSGVENRFLVFS